MRTTIGAVLAAGVLAWAGGARAAVEPGRDFRIMTSFYPMYIHTLNVAGGIPGVTVANLTEPVTGCLHDYQIKSGEMVALSRADAFVVNGLGMEAFLERVVQQQPRLKVIEASRGIDRIGDEHGDNPHVWVAVSGAIRQVENIAAGLAAADPAHAAAYRANAAAYAAKLRALSQRMHAALDGLPRRDIITLHEAFPYFAREFGLRIAAVVEREPGSEPSAGELADTIRLVRKAGITAVFAEPQYPDRAAQVIARESGATVYVLDPAVSGPPTPDAYLAIMERNLAVLKQALK
ncbi:MAG: zinc ABC transporter substrate-binding protein [Lentisphaeria bacterium]